MRPLTGRTSKVGRILRGEDISNLQGRAFDARLQGMRRSMVRGEARGFRRFGCDQRICRQLQDAVGGHAPL